MKIKDLYTKYDIMPQLATHQLRVGGIAKIITQNWQDSNIAHQSVVACLVHDMGNIVKFSGLTDLYWIEKQRQYRDKFQSNDAHVATCGILKEAGLDVYERFIQEEADLYHSTPTEFSQFEKTSKPAVLILYADIRVTPTGVVSIEERARDLMTRYKDKRTEMIYGPPLEQYIQTLTGKRVDLITEKDVEPLFDQLLTMDI